MKRRYTADEAEILKGIFLKNPDYKAKFEKFFKIEQEAKRKYGKIENHSYYIGECMASAMLLVFENIYIESTDGELL